MKKSEIRNPKSEIFLGVDGGQSHTEAIIADERGNILGRGLGGASNHAEIPGGRERLQNAIFGSVGAAILDARRKWGDGETRRWEDGENFEDSSDLAKIVSNFNFASAHCGMTGGAIYKDEIIRSIIKAENLTVGHDAPTALCGAIAGQPGIIVIAGTGSVVFGENAGGETKRAGGLGYVFSDEGSGFWLAAQTIRLAIKEQDGIIPHAGLQKIVLDFFGCAELREVTDDFYNGKLTRDRIAALARPAHDAAQNGNEILRDEIEKGVEVLCRSIESVRLQLNFTKNFPVSGTGGMFRGVYFRERFQTVLSKIAPAANFALPRFGPAIGALLVAYRQAQVAIDSDILFNLEKN